MAHVLLVITWVLNWRSLMSRAPLLRSWSCARILGKELIEDARVGLLVWHTFLFGGVDGRALRFQGAVRRVCRDGGRPTNVRR